jgi:hypothetical protein
MTRNDADDLAQRLYARIPENYRVYDQEQGLPLQALVQVIAEQLANLRQNLDELWDDFFIETCQDWIVPYIGALIGTNLLANPVARSNRLEVRDTVQWRRSKGTVAMLTALGSGTSGWSADTAEFLRSLGWSQNMNHLRMDRSLTADLRDTYRLSLLGRAADPFAHAADIRPANDLDQTRITAASSAMSGTAWGTPGRYQIENVGFFVRRLMAFKVQGATPAAADPGAAAEAGAAYFTFDPLHREMPLFASTAAPITRAAFGNAPTQFFGTDITVRQFGVPLAVTGRPQPNTSTSAVPFAFGGRSGNFTLDPQAGIRLFEPDTLRSGSIHFAITAVWQATGGGTTTLGAISTLLAVQGDPHAYLQGSPTTGAGHLVVTIVTGRPGLGWNLPTSPAARFPGAVIAVRAARAGAPHVGDARYIYLPPAFVSMSGTLGFHVADDGSTFTDATFSPIALARASEGQLYPPLIHEATATPATSLRLLSRGSGALRLVDRARAAGIGMLIQVELFTGIFQPQGAIVTVDQPAGNYTYLDTPADPWRAHTFAPTHSAPPDNVPGSLLAIFLRPLSGNFIPSCELIIQGRGGEALLVYVPEIPQCPTTGMRLFVAADGSTWTVPLNPPLGGLLDAGSVARTAGWQALPIAGNFPPQYRRPQAIDLCRPERTALLRPDELGIDPELGRFALSSGDPAIPGDGFSVDYVEGFADRVGALTYDRMLDPVGPATRLVARTGQVLTTPATNLPVHGDVASAVAAARDGDIIEIVDSATYPVTSAIVLGNARVKTLTIRAAAGHRPCLTFFGSAGRPTTSSFHVTVAMDSLELNGLLLSGGPLVFEREISDLVLEACTLDPRLGPSLMAADPNLTGKARFLLCRCVSGGLRLGNGVAQTTIADSIIDQTGSVAIGGMPAATSPPAPASPPSSPLQTALPPARSVQLERVTVLGQMHCDVVVASESILDDLVIAEDQQSGCIRFSRYETGSQLPRRFQCVPSETDAAACPSSGRCLAPMFSSRRFGRPDYAQFAVTMPTQIVSGSESHSEMGAFAGGLNTVRLANLRTKLTEFMPVGLESVIIAET